MSQPRKEDTGAARRGQVDFDGSLCFLEKPEYQDLNRLKISAPVANHFFFIILSCNATGENKRQQKGNAGVVMDSLS
jgi:hypothetical protein